MNNSEDMVKFPSFVKYSLDLHKAYHLEAIEPVE